MVSVAFFDKSILLFHFIYHLNFLFLYTIHILNKLLSSFKII